MGLATRVRQALSRLGPPRLPRSLKLLAAPAATLLAFLLQLAILPHPGIAPFVFFFLGVALASWLAGRRAGLLAVALSAFVGNYCFLHPLWGWSLSGAALAATALFVVSASAVALLCGSLRAALEEARRSELSGREVG